MGISLKKGQAVSLAKDTLDEVVMGLGWDPARVGWWQSFVAREIDLDASCIMLDAAGQEVDVAFYGKLRSRDGSVRHSGDNLTGAGPGDDEQIHVKLSAVPPHVATLAFTITSFSGQDFTAIANAGCRLVDKKRSQVVAAYTLEGRGRYTALILAVIERTVEGWAMRAVGEPGRGQVYRDVLPLVQQSLRRADAARCGGGFNQARS